MSNSSTGISTIDMMGMPGPIRRLIRIMLRKSTLSHEAILEQVNKLPEEKRPSPEEVDEALEALVSMEWLHKYEEDGKTIYSVKVAKKEGSETTRTGTRQQPNQSSTMGDLWGALDEGAEAAGDGMKAQDAMAKLAAEQREKAEQEGKLGKSAKEEEEAKPTESTVDKSGIAELQQMAVAKTSEIKKITKEQLEAAKKEAKKDASGDTTKSSSATKVDQAVVAKPEAETKPDTAAKKDDDDKPETKPMNTPVAKKEEEKKPDEGGFFKKLFGGGKK